MSKRKERPTEKATPNEGDAGDSSTGATVPPPAPETSEEPVKGDDSGVEGEPAAEGEEESPGETAGAQREQEPGAPPSVPAPRRGVFAQLAHWLWTDLEGN